MITDERLAAMAEALVGVDGVVAVSLGGSRARGTHHAGSDVDLGVYYERVRLDVPGLNSAASRCADGQVAVQPPGSWGPWVDAGG